MQDLVDLNAKAMQLLNLRRIELAIEQAQQMITLSPDSPLGYETLARILITGHRFDEAQLQLDQVAERSPASSELFRLRAIAYRFQNRTKLALQSAQEAISLQPNEPLNHLELGECFATQKKFRLADDSYRKALALDPESAKVHYALGKLFLERKMFSKAEMHFKKSLEIEPNSARSLNDLGVALLSQGKKKESALAFHSALILDPELTVARDNTVLAVNRFLAPNLFVYIVVLVLVVLGIQVLAAQTEDWLGIDELGDFSKFSIYFLAVVSMIVICFWVERKRMRILKKAEPQLVEIYQNIKLDKKSKRRMTSRFHNLFARFF